MYKRLRLYTPIIVILMLLCAALVGLTFFAEDSRLFFVCAALSLFTFMIVLILLRRASKRTRVMLNEIYQDVLYTLGQNYDGFPMPVITVYASSEIVWYNKLCGEMLFGGEELLGEELVDVFPDLDLAVAAAEGRVDIAYADKMYSVYITQRRQEEETFHILFLIEDTQLKYYAREYHLSKPSIALIAVDNYEEMMQDYKDSERAQLMGEIERMVEGYLAANYGYVIKISRDKFLAFIEERGFEGMLANKFDLLDQVRAIQVGARMNATLSIGMGRDAQTLFEAEAMARQALDMCLGRGGDQAAIKTQNGYEFYGGVSKAIEKRTKVKTRIIAAALSELIESSGNVLIMGHRFADLDCLGSAVGLLKAVREMGKRGAIALDGSKNLVGPLIDKLLSGGYARSCFVAPEDSLDMVDEDTLLIIVDTHVPHVLESEELYRACKTVVVIDHHRKLVGHIDDAVIFYHEPYASSASEMVAELVQYFPARPQITRLEAEAMMSGIMLDTKNFVMRTGVRTFEAAAYLRRLGADTVEVRKLFSSSMEAYQQKTSLVATAEVYRNCAIAVAEEQFSDIRVVAPQAADELMTISGVDASFILYHYGEAINISARSMGAFNVQVIMENLGGGGHQTMAAAQFYDDNMENVRRRLMEAIGEICDARDARLQRAEQRQGGSAAHG